MCPDSLQNTPKSPKLKRDPVKMCLEKAECILLQGSHRQRLWLIRAVEIAFVALVDNDERKNPL